MSFLAEYGGVCFNDCGSPIVPGQRITGWLHNGSKVYAHSPKCPEDPETVADRIAKRQPRCDVCGANHPGEC